MSITMLYTWITFCEQFNLALFIISLYGTKVEFTVQSRQNSTAAEEVASVFSHQLVWSRRTSGTFQIYVENTFISLSICLAALTALLCLGYGALNKCVVHLHLYLPPITHSNIHMDRQVPDGDINGIFLKTEASLWLKRKSQNGSVTKSWLSIMCCWEAAVHSLD